MRTAMDDLCIHNQTLENKILHIHHRQHDINMVRELEVLDPQPLLYEIWEVLVP